MWLGFLILVPLPWMFNFFLIISANAEGDALFALKSNLSDPNLVLTSWDATLVNPCTWYHISCNNYNSVTQILLGSANLSGQLVPQLGSLPNFQYLELYNNTISGQIPHELGNLTNLVRLDLYLNNLSGPIPDELGKLHGLNFLRLNNNSLSGTIPMSLTSITALQVLDLSFNNLSGIIPDNGSFSLFSVVSFEGNPYLKRVFSYSFEGNPYLKTPTPSSRSMRVISGVAAGVGVGVILLLSTLAIAFVHYRRRKHRVQFFDLQAKED